MSKTVVEKTFALGPGTLYVLPGSADKRSLETRGICVGDTDDGCVFEYNYKVKNLYDVDGRACASIKYGTVVHVTGKLVRIAPEALEVLMTDARARGGALSMLLVCKLPNDEEFTLFARGGAGSASKLALKAGGGLEFDFVCGEDCVAPSLKLREAVG